MDFVDKHNCLRPRWDATAPKHRQPRQPSGQLALVRFVPQRLGLRDCLDHPRLPNRNRRNFQVVPRASGVAATRKDVFKFLSCALSLSDRVYWLWESSPALQHEKLGEVCFERTSDGFI